MADTILCVVDDEDHIVGRALRSEIHRNGLLHREIHVWFITLDGQLILQRRAATKDTFPLYLDATVGGHVEEGQSYLDAAIAESFEETGRRLTAAELKLVMYKKSETADPERGAINNAMRAVYVHVFRGDVSDLKVEAQDGAGFETMPLRDILDRNGDRLNELVPAMLTDAYLPVFIVLENLIAELQVNSKG